MKRLLLALALLAPALASAQSWTLTRDVTVPYTTPPASGLHGLAVDGQNRLWVQHFRATEPIMRNGTARTTHALYVMNPDGTQAPCSPVTFINNAAGTRIDTLGLFSLPNGAPDTRTGRGLESDNAGNILASQFDLLYSLDATSCTGIPANSIRQIARAQPLPGLSLTGAASDGLGNAYITSVVGGNPIVEFGPALVTGPNVAAASSGFNRKLVASQDGLFVFDLGYTSSGIVVFYRPDVFSPFTNIGVTARGIKAESGTRQPGTNLLWFSAGAAGDGANQDPTVTTFYQNNAWYAFAIEDLVRFQNGVATAAIETRIAPRDSIVVGAGFRDAAGAELVGPRGIAFSRDGRMAYVTNFGAPTATAVKQFTKSTTAITGGTAPEGFALGQNQPNPFSSRTEISLTLPEASHVRLRVYDMTGRVVATLADAPMAAGTHVVPFEAGRLAAGMYVYTVETNGYGTSRRLAIVR